MQRAAAFARQHQVYFMPVYQILRYGDTGGFNGLALFTPEGEVAYEYEKTLSWYATTSDGLVDSLQTPYGRIGAADAGPLRSAQRAAPGRSPGWSAVEFPRFRRHQTVFRVG